jgi:hypothetical protein
MYKCECISSYQFRPPSLHQWCHSPIFNDGACLRRRTPQTRARPIPSCLMALDAAPPLATAAATRSAAAATAVAVVALATTATAAAAAAARTSRLAEMTASSAAAEEATALVALARGAAAATSPPRPTGALLATMRGGATPALGRVGAALDALASADTTRCIATSTRQASSTATCVGEASARQTKARALAHD